MTRSLVLLATLGVANVVLAQSPPPTPERLALDASAGVAPQPPRAADSYRRARPLTAETFDGMLFCEVSVSGESWDGRDPGGPVRRYMGRVELDAEIVLPARDDLVRFHGPNDTNRVVFAIAGVRLQTGSRLSISLFDRDVIASDPIGIVPLTYDGSLPMRGSLPDASVECRGLPAESVADAVASAIRNADAALAALATVARPDRTLVSFRPEDADPTDALLASYEIARYAGLADPRFLERRDSLRRHEAEFVAARTALVGELESGAPAVGATIALPGASIELVVERVDCGVENTIELHSEFGLDVPMECALRLVFRNPGAATSLGWQLHLVDDLGDTTEVTRFAVASADGITRVRSIRVERGETRVVIPSPTRRVRLIRLAKRRTLAWGRTSVPETARAASSAR